MTHRRLKLLQAFLEQRGKGNAHDGDPFFFERLALCFGSDAANTAIGCFMIVNSPCFFRKAVADVFDIRQNFAYGGAQSFQSRSFLRRFRRNCPLVVRSASRAGR